MPTLSRLLPVIAGLVFVLSDLMPAAVTLAGEPAASRTLPRSVPEEQGVSSAELLAFVEAADSKLDSLHSFMLVRHGHVVAEGWWGPYDARTRHVLYSLSKSFASTAVGLAVAEGKLSVDDEVLKFFPDEAPAEPSANLKSMRINDLLRMSTGHQTEAVLFRDEPGYSAAHDSWTKKFLAHAVPFKPGTHFVYNSPATFMLSAIVQKQTGMSLHEYLGPRLYGPLGIEDPIWQANAAGESFGAFGLLIRTEDIARFGQLYLQKGKWQGQQLIPESWVEAATARQTSNGSSPKSDWDQGYGYQFWCCRNGAYRGDGAFGQYCIVLPEQDAVIAITSGLRDMQVPLDLVWGKLLPALKPRALESDTSAHQQLVQKLNSLSLRRPSGRAAGPLAGKVSGRWYDLPENDRGIQAISFDFGGEPNVLTVRTAGGEVRTQVGVSAWVKNPLGFVNGLDRSLGVPSQPLVAASGAWTADDTYTVKLALYETPFTTTLVFKFDGDRLVFDAEHNVAFGPGKVPQIVGTARVARLDAVPAAPIQLLVRADDMGAAQAVNEACIKSYREGIARSVEVIVPGPWFLDAVRLIKQNPDLDVGVHLALTSEWERVKWRPLTHAPSLVDEDGYFRPMTRQRPDFPPNTGFLDAQANLAEVERELRAQIETARRHFGKQLSHVSAHMFAARATPELQDLTKRLAHEYGLGMEDAELKSAGSFGNSKSTGDEREKLLVELVERLQPGKWLIVEHPGLDTPEMRNIGHKGYENVATDRAAVTQAFISAKVKEAIARRKIELISYAEK